MSQRPSRHPNFGRNQKFTPETCERIVRCIGNGNFRCTAATMAGVSQQSMSTWMKPYRFVICEVEALMKSIGAQLV